MAEKCPGHHDGSEQSLQGLLCYFAFVTYTELFSMQKDVFLLLEELILEK